jgi:hypothetical protein
VTQKIFTQVCHLFSMNGGYLVFAIAVFLTIFAGCLKLIRGNGIGDYIVTFLVFLVFGFVVLWVYRKITGKPGIEHA